MGGVKPDRGLVWREWILEREHQLRLPYSALHFSRPFPFKQIEEMTQIFSIRSLYRSLAPCLQVSDQLNFSNTKFPTCEGLFNYAFLLCLCFLLNMY